MNKVGSDKTANEKSHADKTFKDKFDRLAEYCSETYELGYEMLWQGVPE